MKISKYWKEDRAYPTSAWKFQQVKKIPINKQYKEIRVIIFFKYVITKKKIWEFPKNFIQFQKLSTIFHVDHEKNEKELYCN